MRVIAGEFGGRRLTAPPGRGTRPTAERVREAIFSMLGPVDGVDVLDLFAGSGALAIEALSRGAARATVVERSRPACAAIAENVAALGLDDRVRVVRRDWRAALRTEAASERRYGLCVIDPPYAAIESVARSLRPVLEPVLEPTATVVLEHSRRIESPLLGWGEVVERRYGDSAVSIARRGGAA